MRQFLRVLLCGAVVLGLASVSFATTINVDVDFQGSTYSGLGVSPDTGTYWNSFAAQAGTYTSGALTASDGTTATSATVTVSGVGRYNNATAAFAPALMDDYLYGSPANGVGFSIDNLTPGGAYDLYIYSLNGAGASATTGFTIGSATKNATNSAASTFAEGNNYVLFKGVIATSGSISGTAIGLRDANSIAINGFQITSVPEPATVVLLATGLIGLLAYAWRKQK
jgi:hypothetical protein